MPASSSSGDRRPFWLECGPRRTAALQAGASELRILVWRLAIGWRGPAGGTAAWLLPFALVERRGGRERWRLVPDLTLAVGVLGVAVAAWVAFRPGWGTAPRHGGE